MSRFTTSISEAAEFLRAGKLVAFPTETVYGLGANALDVAAVAHVFEAKNRPHFDPLIVHIADEAWLPRLVTDIPPAAQKLAEAFWPGPLTLVLPKTDLVPDLVTSGLPGVAVRMPSHPMARQLLRETDLPVAAPSANPFGQLSPTTAQHVAETLGERIDLILDGGPCEVGLESTVVHVHADGTVLLRQGGITQEDIERIIGSVAVRSSSSSGAAPAPGMLDQHYAPRTPLMLYEQTQPADLSGRRVGALLLMPQPVPVVVEAVEVLTEQGDLRTAAAGFFAALRRLDQLKLDVIVAWRFPDAGLGRALNDRLRRACHR